MKALILAGGRSRRMGRAKGSMTFREGLNQVDYTAGLLGPFCEEVFLSLRPDQEQEGWEEERIVRDAFGEVGPLGALASAQLRGGDWLVVACDLPLLNEAAIAQLCHEKTAELVCFESRFDGRPEPLCAIWREATALSVKETVQAEKLCARHLIEDLKGAGLEVMMLKPEVAEALDNANTPEEAERIQEFLKGGERGEKKVTVHYFGGLSEQAGVKVETRLTSAETLGELFSECAGDHKLTLAKAAIRPALNAEFSDWQALISDRDEVALMPPFAGG